MQATYGDKCVDVSTVDVGYGSLGKKGGKPLVLGEKKYFFFFKGRSSETCSSLAKVY